MPRTVERDDEWDDDESDDDEWVSDESDDELPTILCSHCRSEMLEESIRCPSCGEYRSDEDSPAEPKPTWVVVGLILCFLAVFFWLAS